MLAYIEREEAAFLSSSTRLNDMTMSMDVSDAAVSSVSVVEIRKQICSIGCLPMLHTQ